MACRLSGFAQSFNEEEARLIDLRYSFESLLQWARVGVEGALVIDRAMTLGDEIKPLGQRYERKRANVAAERGAVLAPQRRCPDGGFFDG